MPASFALGRSRVASTTVTTLCSLALACAASAGACSPDDDGSIDLFPDTGAPDEPELEPVTAVSCDSADDCPAELPICLTTDASCLICLDGECVTCPTAVCVECTAGDQCARGVCDTLTHRCLECADASDCDGSHPLCVGGECVECTEDAECQEWQPRCVAGKCAECSSDADCDPYDPFCLLDSGWCVECLADSDCSSGQHCTDHDCRS